jgi:hypothetical protein
MKEGRFWVTTLHDEIKGGGWKRRGLPTCKLCYKDLNEHDFLKVLFVVQELFLRRLRHFSLETLNCEVWK